MEMNFNRSHRPETESQARTWARVMQHALDFGLCDACAAQLAWACQNGFATVHPPCASCAAAVLRLPVPKLNGWRTVAGSASDRRAWAALRRAPGPGGVVAPAAADTRVAEAHTAGEQVTA